MANTIQIDRFTRQNQSVSGGFAPQDLPGLVDYLAGTDGQINYVLSGYLVSDLPGSQKRCVKCIISGWFLLADPVTSKPTRHDCSIASILVVVSEESDLPPLEMESDDEDYIVAGAELNVLERVEEEVLLNLPAAYGGKSGEPGKTNRQARQFKSNRTPANAGAPAGKISPFAKLANWKKK